MCPGLPAGTFFQLPEARFLISYWRLVSAVQSKAFQSDACVCFLNTRGQLFLVDDTIGMEEKGQNRCSGCEYFGCDMKRAPLGRRGREVSEVSQLWAG